MRSKKILFSFFLSGVLAGVHAQRASFNSDCACNDSAKQTNERAIGFHKQRCLTDASENYQKALRFAPPRDVSAAEKKLILQFTPKLFETAAEPFPLKDVAAIMHPGAPWIAYHLFWEDDIDFPDDNDPCDHEVIWVRLNEAGTSVKDCYTYFHGRILRAPKQAIEEANRKGGGPEIYTQWGKHGSMPKYWQQLSIIADAKDAEYSYMKKDSPTITLYMYNEAIYKKLSTEGRQSIHSPLARQWPKKFEGSFSDFITFSKKADLETRLKESDHLMISCLNNAVINRYFLRYNFAVKTEWPAPICEDMKAPRPAHP